jgi:hypothetical protein
VTHDVIATVVEYLLELVFRVQPRSQDFDNLNSVEKSQIFVNDTITVLIGLIPTMTSSCQGWLDSIVCSGFVARN